MYNSPIEIVQSTIDQVRTEIVAKQDEYIYQTVLQTGVNVDKAELIKALVYDRDQYEQGYIDGAREVVEKLKAQYTSMLTYDTHEDAVLILHNSLDKLLQEVVGDSYDQ